MIISPTEDNLLIIESKIHWFSPRNRPNWKKLEKWDNEYWMWGYNHVMHFGTRFVQKFQCIRYLYQKTKCNCTHKMKYTQQNRISGSHTNQSKKLENQSKKNKIKFRYKQKLHSNAWKIKNHLLFLPVEEGVAFGFGFGGAIGEEEFDDDDEEEWCWRIDFGAVKWSKAIFAAWFWASLDDRHWWSDGVWNCTELTVTVDVNLGLWSGPSFTAVYSGKFHECWWHSSWSFDLYIFQTHRESEVNIMETEITRLYGFWFL